MQHLKHCIVNICKADLYSLISLLSIIWILVANMSFQAMACTCVRGDEARENAMMKFSILKAKSIVIGQALSVTSSTVYSTSSSFLFAQTTYTIRFQVQKAIKGTIQTSVISVREIFTFTGISSCITPSGILNNGLDTNRFILFLDSSSTPIINQEVCFVSSQKWTQSNERKIDSLNQTIIATGIREVDRAKDNNVEYFPNPCRDYATLRYNLSHISYVKIEILNIQGQVVRSVAEYTSQKSGENIQLLDFTGLVDGLYFCRIYSLNGVQSQRIVLSQ